MLFCDPSEFAIEAMIEPDLEVPSLPWGRMCLRIGKLTLGDYAESHCGLGQAYSHLKELAALQSRLWDDSFKAMSLEQIYDTVNDAIYTDDDSTLEQIETDLQRYADFDFCTNWGEQFDGYSAVIVSPNEATLAVLHRPINDQSLSIQRSSNFVQAHCSHEAFTSAVEAFAIWYDSEEERLSA